ncbi:MAG: ribonuclease, partial [Thermoanaerobaculia bacterium]|nr:ribonuclease [Thermoanaerobaculia bacterium]
MSRELIVSVNGKEKKIAIVENDRVTEFYIERGEQNQGIVGNIYKGRVMRVLPGMQSAFVDIGLERDAFLYVTDFFDEEAEFERIVVDKSKKVDPETATRAATEHIEQSRVEREHHIEGAQERAEPLRDAPLVEGEGVVAPEKSEEPEDGGPRRRGRRGGRGRGRTGRTDGPEERRVVPTPAEPIDTPFVTLDSSFERISDDEERAMNGEMLKDARLQERLLDEVHAAEFDMEDLPSAPVGSLLTDASLADSSFQRIADDDDGGVAPHSRARELEAARVRKFIDEVADESSRSLSFERISDDEVASDNVTEAATTVEPEIPEPAIIEPAPAAKKPARRSPTTTRKKKPSVIDRLFKSKKVEDEPEIEADALEATDASLADSEASIKTGRVHEEFATRRGGRRRRRPSAKRPEGEGESADGAEGANGLDEEAEAAESAPAELEAHAPETSEEQVQVAEQTAEPQEAKPSSEARQERRPPAPRGGGRGGRRPARHERAPQPAITDLLKEGQEILVQIAKEPIAKKGARITSHIALPGRFLVYMPTVEHLGVSRKIESDSERTRLRKLIQKIHVEEGQPAGGFIVRTAGVGASETDLHADAVYLLRTWHDLRQDAEKAKAPALVHKDLDLVQRILRD